MKELTIEEKAKAYDEVIEKLRDFYRDYDTISHLIDVKEELANLIPELKESEDEKIKKEIISFLKEGKPYYCPNSVRRREWIAWLENQGKHKVSVVDFKAKDWYVSKVDGKIHNIYYSADKAENQARKLEIEKQGKQKTQAESAIEMWKDMRLEVYQQASGNRHEPNYSDDSTKTFSLTDIDEIFEKIVEKQGEQKPVE